MCCLHARSGIGHAAKMPTVPIKRRRIRNRQHQPLIDLHEPKSTRDGTHGQQKGAAPFEQFTIVSGDDGRLVLGEPTQEGGEIYASMVVHIEFTDVVDELCCLASNTKGCEYVFEVCGGHNHGLGVDDVAMEHFLHRQNVRICQSVFTIMSAPNRAVPGSSYVG